MKKIICNSKKNGTAEVLISDADYEKVSALKWYVNSRGYVVHSLPGGHKLSLHRFIMGNEVPKNYDVDHINHNKLDNRRENLRPATRQENSRNRRKMKASTAASQYKGVSRSSSKVNPWRAYIYIDDKSVHLGNFKTEFRAARAYDKAALEAFGPHACINFPANAYISCLVAIESYYDALMADSIA